MLSAAWVRLELVKMYHLYGKYPSHWSRGLCKMPLISLVYEEYEENKPRKRKIFPRSRNSAIPMTTNTKARH